MRSAISIHLIYAMVQPRFALSTAKCLRGQAHFDWSSCFIPALSVPSDATYTCEGTAPCDLKQRFTRCSSGGRFCSSLVHDVSNDAPLGTSSTTALCPNNVGARGVQNSSNFHDSLLAIGWSNGLWCVKLLHSRVLASIKLQDSSARLVDQPIA